MLFPQIMLKLAERRMSRVIWTQPRSDVSVTYAVLAFETDNFLVLETNRIPELRGGSAAV